jgi:hypothetical protein
VGHERLEVARLAGAVLGRVADQDGVAAREGEVLDPPGQVGEEGVRAVGQEQAERAAAARRERGRDRVAPVAELGDRAQDALALLLADRARRSAHTTRPPSTRPPAGRRRRA